MKASSCCRFITAFSCRLVLWRCWTASSQSSTLHPPTCCPVRPSVLQAPLIFAEADGGVSAAKAAVSNLPLCLWSSMWAGLVFFLQSSGAGLRSVRRWGLAWSVARGDGLPEVSASPGCCFLSSTRCGVFLRGWRFEPSMWLCRRLCWLFTWCLRSCLAPSCTDGLAVGCAPPRRQSLTATQRFCYFLICWESIDITVFTLAMKVPQRRCAQPDTAGLR